jgi:hypothetical protein
MVTHQRRGQSFPSDGSEPRIFEHGASPMEIGEQEEPVPFPLTEDEDAGSIVMRQSGALDQLDIQATVAEQVRAEPEMSLSVSSLTLKGPAGVFRSIVLPVLGMGVFGILATVPFSPVTVIVGSGVLVVVLADMHYCHRSKR